MGFGVLRAIYLGRSLPLTWEFWSDMWEGGLCVCVCVLGWGLSSLLGKEKLVFGCSPALGVSWHEEVTGCACLAPLGVSAVR